MTVTLRVFVYPDAYPTHGTWAAVLLYLMARDHLIAKRYARG
ncbi:MULTISPECIES: hypothetical protein [Pseudomonas]|jgi:putative oxidoreductase|nr:MULTISPECIES: hypothetical protein [Pseudomonas]TCV66879.1 hypothetical protein EDB98_10535 [Pseudomonas fluorescens]SFW72431.1 putative oxidoreductase [Pseudomonas sp. NFACC04-2]